MYVYIRIYIYAYIYVCIYGTLLLQRRARRGTVAHIHTQSHIHTFTHNAHTVACIYIYGTNAHINTQSML